MMAGEASSRTRAAKAMNWSSIRTAPCAGMDGHHAQMFHNPKLSYSIVANNPNPPAVRKNTMNPRLKRMPRGDESLPVAG